MKGSPEFPGGSSENKPTWSNPLVGAATSAFFICSMRTVHRITDAALIKDQKRIAP